MELRKLFIVKKEKGSLALEQILFIGAIVTMSVGIFAFYGDIQQYFTDFSVAGAPQNVGQSPNGVN